MIELPYPAKILWPNGRGHWGSKGRETKKHRGWAYAATLADATRPAAFSRLVVTVYPKPRGPLPDRDGVVGAMKAYQDGVADACRINDRELLEPRVQFAERCAEGRFVLDYAND